MDLYSITDGTIQCGGRLLVKTGIAVELPPHTYLRIAPRSGLANKFGIDVLAGVVDPGYTGEIGVILQNLGDEIMHVRKGDKIAQGILENAIRADIVEVDELSESERGSKGYGSSGNR
jgi:dUTP pyrophosphatase